MARDSDGNPKAQPAGVRQLNGTEPLLPGITVRDFWAWAMGDLRLNATRGMLAQFLVARAVGDTRPNDEGWGDFDVLSPEGIRIEVKSSGYLQSWAQKRPSIIVFSSLTGRSWSPATGYSESRQVRADVFVFAVQTCKCVDDYDPLDLTAWDFYVVPGSTIQATGQRSMNLTRVRELAGKAVPWAALHETIMAVNVPALPSSS